MVEYDRLTGTYSLKSFLEECEVIIKSDNRSYAIASMDISNFKFINDYYGMDKADELLKSFAKMLMDNERCVLVARVVGDQFRALYCIDGMSIEELADEIAEKNKDFVRIHSEQFSDTLWHIYAAVYQVKDKNEPVRNAVDKAHHAKKSMKGDYSKPCTIYSDEEYAQFSNSIEMIKLLELAVNNHDMVLVNLQPKYSISTGKIIGAEALGRLLDRNGRVIMPGEFVPVLEKTRLITLFDSIVMEKTFSIIKKWMLLGLPVVPVSINVSRVQPFDEAYVEKVISLRDKYGIPSKYIEIEVTESVFMEDSEEVYNNINKLRQTGIKINLDDFGSGYTSFNAIGCFPTDVIKLDRGFIKTSLNTDRGKSIIESVIKMLDKVGFELICEGIETQEEARIMLSFNCDSAQGFYFDKPMPVDEFEKKLIINSMAK